jgi:hypothetical protein
MPGFRFNETMSGSYTREGEAAEHPISFTVRARAHSLIKHARDRKATLDGRLRMEGFAADVPIEGELIINPVFGRMIRYTFDFAADDGKRYHFLGQKDVTLFDPVGSMTTLPATISDDQGKTIARAMLRFDTRDLPRFLASFRPLL